MSRPQSATTSEYSDTLLRYYEEEVSGEAYFYGLAEYFSEREKTILLARVERVAAKAIEPLLRKYGLTARDESILYEEGMEHVAVHQSYSWREFMTYIVARYPGYLDDFRTLEAIAPAEDLPALGILTEHEVVVIDFAEKELVGHPDSTEPLIRYVS